MKTLVIGASGLVGGAILRQLRTSGIDVFGTCASRASGDLIALNIADPGQVHRCLDRIRPEIVFLTAALTHVDYCEDHPDEARRINVEGARSVAAEAQRVGARVVYFSTEYVFDGAAGPYDEQAEPRPLSVYGLSKLEGEEAVRSCAHDSLTIRTTVVYGWDPNSKNFAMQVYDRLQTQTEMTVPDDQIGNPTPADYLAEASIKLAQRGISGIVNVVGRDWLPRSDFAKALVRSVGGDPDLVVPVSTASLKQRAARPLRGGLKTDRLCALLGEEPISLAEALERFKSAAAAGGR